MTGATTLTFLSPLGGLLVLAAVLPLAGLALAGRRVAAARTLLGLERPPGGAPRSTVVALAAVPVLLGIAAAQPAIRAPETANVRTDAQAMFLIDTSRSMLAAPSAGEPSRLARAQRAAVRMRSALGDVSAGVGTLTDRALPNLLPVADAAAFDATVERAIGIERPPPQEMNVNATTLAPLSELATQGYYSPSARRRLLVVMTDGESRAYDVGEVGTSAARGTRRFVDPRALLELGRARLSLVGPAGGGVPAARGESPRARPARRGGRRSELRRGRARRRDYSGTERAGNGPTASQGIRPRTIPLAPYVAAAALLPLALLFRRRGGQ